MTNQNNPGQQGAKQDQQNVGQQTGHQQKQGGPQCKKDDKQGSQYDTPGQSGQQK